MQGHTEPSREDPSLADPNAQLQTSVLRMQQQTIGHTDWQAQAIAMQQQLVARDYDTEEMQFHFKALLEQKEAVTVPVQQYSHAPVLLPQQAVVSVQMMKPTFGSSTHTPLSAVTQLVTFPNNHGTYVPKVSVIQPQGLNGVPQVAMLPHAPPTEMYGSGVSTSLTRTLAPIIDTQQLIAGLTQAINRPKGRSGMKPPVFKGVGSDNIEVWLDHIARLCRLDNLDERYIMEWMPC